MADEQGTPANAGQQVPGTPPLANGTPPMGAGERLIAFLINEYQLAKASPLTTRIGGAMLFVVVFKVVGPEEMNIWKDALLMGVSVAGSIGLIQARDR